MKRILFVMMLLPATLGAQTRTVVSTYLGTDASFAGDPLMVGLTAARETGPLAARVAVGFDMSSPTPALEGSALAAPRGIWSSDVDALLFIGRPAGDATLIPYAIGGVGARGYSQDGLELTATYSYGAGFRAPLGGGFAMEGEVRRRELFGAGGDAAAPAVTPGMEYRVGASFGFGGRAPLVLPNVRPAPLPIRGSIAAAPTSVYASADTRTRVVAATLSTGERFIGVPYKWGGNTPTEGFDCSGFIRYVFAQQGLSLPRVSRDQAQFGTALPLDIRHFQPGDILAFASDGRTVDHTAIYAGNGRILHSSSSGRGVRYDDLYSQRGSWYVEHLVAARRVVDTALAIAD